MGARFDKWLARPSTIHFLRQLVGPEHAAAPTKRARYATSSKISTRPHSTSHAPARHPQYTKSHGKSYNAQAIADLETFQEQRRRVAKELRLHIPDHYHDPRTSPQHQVPELSGYSNLLYAETRVRDISSARGLLIDLPENMHNLEAWRQILKFRERADGFNGVLDVWKGMRKRGVDLPVKGEYAATFWTIFLHAAIVQERHANHKALLQEVYTHAEELKTLGRGHYRFFHKILLGRFLRVAPRGHSQIGPEYDWHIRSRENGLCAQQSLAEVVLDVLKSSRPHLAFSRFRKMYMVDGERDLYDLCMPLVLLHSEGDKGKAIIAWHNFFVKHDDRPGPELAASQSIQYLLGLDDTQDGSSLPDQFEESELTRLLSADRATAARSLFPSLSRSSMNSLVGDVYGIKPKAISDKFCARMFATQTFSLETIIRGIAMLGTEALGPEALRELAIRAGSPEEFKNRLADVRDSGMQLVPSIYTRLLERVANISHHELFQTFLESDQHPENYDDQHVQESLLADFLRTERWSQAYLTLMALSQADRSMAGRAWNRLLQHHVKARDYSQIVRVFDHIFSEQLELSRRSLNFMLKYLLATRLPGKMPVVSDKAPVGAFRSLDFVVNAHIYAAARGADVEHSRWIEFLKRYGMSGKMEEVANLTIWLANNCPSRLETSYVRREGLVKRKRQKMPARSTIFNPIMLRAIVIWGFRNAGNRDALQSPLEMATTAEQNLAATLEETKHVELWAQGLSILSHLKRHGVQIQTSNVRRALEEVLWIWFGPGLSKRNINMQNVRRNELSLAHYLTHANQIWDEPLFDLDPHLFDDTRSNETELLCAVFGHARRVDQKSGTWVDVEAWATAKAEGMWRPNFPNRQARHDRNEYIPAQFRFVDNLPRQERRVMRVNRVRRERVVAPPEDNALIPPQHPPPVAQPLNLHPQSNLPHTPEQP